MKYPVWFGLGGIILGLLVGFTAGRLCRSPGPAVNTSKEDANSSESTSSPEERPIVRLSDEQIKDFGIEIAQAGPGKLREQRVLPGEIVLNPDEVAYIVPRVSGIAVQINKTLGDPVREGEVMAVVDSREAADAKAGYLAAVERLSLAQASFDREKKLWEKKVSSEEDYLNAKRALAEAGIALRNARQNLYVLGFDQDYLVKLSDLPDASYTRYEVCAPFTGTVMDKHIGLGELVTDTSQIYQIADLSTVWAELTVYQKDIGVIQKDQTVAIQADNVDIHATGTIEYVSPVIEPSTRTAVARVVLCNSQGTWRPGTFVTGQVDVDTVDVSVAVARSAIEKLEDREVIFLQTDKGFEPHTVQLGRTDPELVEILSGLKSGQKYASANAFTLKAELSKSTFAGGDDD